MNSAQNRALWQALTTEEDPKKSIRMLAEVLKSIWENSSEEYKSIQANIETLRRIIMGNGQPSRGMLSRLERLEESNKKMSCDMEVIKALLIGDASKGADNESILDKVQHTQKLANGAVKLSWMVLAVVIGQIVAALLQII